jgi:hypothetical protein
VSEPLVEVPEAVAGSWHDAIPVIADAALEQLRLTAADVDAGRVAGKAPAACASIDRRLDLRSHNPDGTVVPDRVIYTDGGVEVTSYAAGHAPADVLEAAVVLTVELYGRKDARFGVLPGTSIGEPVRISADHLRGVESLLEPHVEGWGIG